jgi:hypothetical protein
MKKAVLRELLKNREVKTEIPEFVEKILKKGAVESLKKMEASLEENKKLKEAKPKKKAKKGE